MDYIFPTTNCYVYGRAKELTRENTPFVTEVICE